MRIEIAVEKLVNATKTIEMSPERLSKLMELTVNKVSEMSPVGTQARQMFESRMLREALKREFKIKRFRGGTTLVPKPKTRSPRVIDAPKPEEIKRGRGRPRKT